MSRIGTDPLSSALLNFAKTEQLDVTHIAQDNLANIGIYSVTTDANGERSFHYWRSQSAARQLFSNDASVEAIPAAQVTYLSGITLAIMQPDARQRLMGHLKTESEAGRTRVAFDSNYRPQLWESKAVAKAVISDMWQIADIAFPSIDDEMLLYGETEEKEVLERFAQRRWTACTIKRGSLGPLSLTSTVNTSYEPATTVVDTTAAGDSFNGGYLAAFIQGESEQACLAAGHGCAVKVVGQSGAIIPRGA